MAIAKVFVFELNCWQLKINGLLHRTNHIFYQYSSKNSEQQEEIWKMTKLLEMMKSLKIHNDIEASLKKS